MRELPCDLTRLIYALKLARAGPQDRNDRHDSHAPHLYSTVTYNTKGMPCVEGVAVRTVQKPHSTLVKGLGRYGRTRPWACQRLSMD